MIQPSQLYIFLSLAQSSSLSPSLWPIWAPGSCKTKVAFVVIAIVVVVVVVVVVAAVVPVSWAAVAFVVVVVFFLPSHFCDI